MNHWENTRRAYIKLLEKEPSLYPDIEHLIKCVLIDCRNGCNESFTDLESQIRGLGNKEHAKEYSNYEK